uniref:Uncharacterized protein n=1 Tax=Oryza sativa subsp. japonica TaxID=39947 RepID=Q84SH7_ORYSJ|nr:hypothetical protein [Oryza sativa Japonica Group]
MFRQLARQVGVRRVSIDKCDGINFIGRRLRLRFGSFRFLVVDNFDKLLLFDSDSNQSRQFQSTMAATTFTSVFPRIFLDFITAAENPTCSN